MALIFTASSMMLFEVQCTPWDVISAMRIARSKACCIVMGLFLRGVGEKANRAGFEPAFTGLEPVVLPLPLSEGPKLYHPGDQFRDGRVR